MSVAWKVNAWATNSWLGMNGGPPNAWRGATTPVPPPVVTPSLGGKGDNIFKPDQLGFRTRTHERIEESADIHREAIAQAAKEFFAEPPTLETPIQAMTLAEIDFEIGHLLHKQIKTQEDELMLLLLMAAS